MPRISEFLGIVIRMHYEDHAPPHFHAQYAEFSAAITISARQVLKGLLPPRVLALVVEWAGLHERELNLNWDLARSRRPLNRIEPLV